MRRAMHRLHPQAPITLLLFQLPLIHGTAAALSISNWSMTENWVGNVAPIAGDNLVFPAGAARLDNVNDYPAGTTFGSITVSGSGYKFTNAGNITSASIQVQSGMQMETDKIVTGTLTIGAGAIVTITPIAGGPLTVNKSLAPLSASSSKQILSTTPIYALTTAASITAIPPATSNMDTVSSSPVTSSAVTINSTQNVLPDTSINTLAITKSIITDARTIESLNHKKVIISAVNHLPAQSTYLSHSLLALSNVLEGRLNNPLFEPQTHGKTTISALSSLEEKIPLRKNSFDKKSVYSVNKQLVHTAALETLLEKAEQGFDIDTSEPILAPKHMRHVGKAVDKVLAEEDENLLTILRMEP